MGGDGYLPEDQGFKINKGGHDLGWPAGGYFSPYENPKLQDGLEGEYLTDRLTDESLHFLDNIGHKPFLLFLSHYAVHTPLECKKEMEEKYKEKAANLPPIIGSKFVPEGEREARQVQDHPVYAGMIQSMDESLGRLMDKLEALGIAEHTAIIFISDNGGLSTAEGSPPSNIPLRAGKGWLYEGGIREPMIIKWPNVTHPGSVCHEPVISTDFYPTMLEMAGLPLKPVQHVDGLSLVALLKQKASLPRKALYWHYPHFHGGGGKPSGSVRAGDYKLIEFFEDNHVELYNLNNDLSENNEISAENPQKVEELRNMLHEWRKEVNAITPTPESLKKYLEMIKKEQEDKKKK